MSTNALIRAKVKHFDEFYTRMEDIADELPYYKRHFRDKTVYCNCDDPLSSNFFRYFVQNFHSFGLKKLIATCCSFGTAQASHTPKTPSSGRALKAVVTSVPTGELPLAGEADIRALLVREGNELSVLTGDGDYRSPECLALLDASDMVVTNEPFSELKTILVLLVNRQKQFLVIGDQNAVSYKEVFPLLRDGKLWLGVHHPKRFYTPAGGIQEFGNICWFTNLPHDACRKTVPLRTAAENLKYCGKLRKKLISYYGQDENHLHYPHYHNYDAIEVPYVECVPSNFNGVMAVPLTWLSSHTADDGFRIVGADLNRLVDELGVSPVGEEWLTAYRNSGGTGHYTANMHSLVIITDDGRGIAPYKRILIQRKRTKGEGNETK